MGKREGVIGSVHTPADGGVSPNARLPYITAELRVHWPPLATEAQIMDAIHAAVDQAVAKVLANGHFIATIPASPAGLGVDDSAPITQTGDHIV